MENKLKRTLLLDIDGTLIQRSLLQWFLEYLIRRRRIRLRNALREAFRLSAAFTRKFYQWEMFYFRGYAVSDVETWARECWDHEMRGRVHEGLIQPVRELQEKGAGIVLLSGTIPCLAELFHDIFHIDAIICSEPEIQDGRFTGRLIRPHPWGIRKYRYADQWLAANGRGWDQTLAMGNEWVDRHVFRHSTPVAIRPRRLLRFLAWRKGWPVIDDVDDENAVRRVIDEQWRKMTDHSGYPQSLPGSL
ncbi:HAD-IB family phosphatase [bacterium]|nr:HAD-IB family phosphatase [bacterium]